jgi:cell division protein FtsW
MHTVPRTDRSILGHWWWTVDRWTLTCLILMMGFGGLLSFAASPAIAERIGLTSFGLAHRHLMLLPLAIAAMGIVSVLSVKIVRRLAILGFMASIFFLILVLVAGTEMNGATRWFSVLGFSLQPSEFLKPCFAISAAWLFTLQREAPGVPGNLLSFVFYILCVILLIMQPDLGQTLLISAIWGTQLVLAGLSIYWIIALIGGGALGVTVAYFAIPHVQNRIDVFLDPSGNDAYQVTQSILSFSKGGLFGRGPGEGSIKSILPDAHADFVFAVIGEEFGAIACFIIVMLVMVVVLRGLLRMISEDNFFITLATTGLLMQFGLQAVINMSTSLNLIPTKGMTLPFISYGGSSLLAMAFGMGAVLAFTRKRPSPRFRQFGRN